MPLSNTQLEKRIIALEARDKAQDAKIASVEGKVANLEASANIQGTAIVSHEARLDALEEEPVPPPPDPGPDPPPGTLPEPNRDAFIVTMHDKIPNFGKAPTIWSVKSGAWNDRIVWNLGRIPTAGDVVSITGTTAVDYDYASQQNLKCVVIQNTGRLIFHESVNTYMMVTHLLVLEGGTLTTGDDVTPISSAVTCEIVFADVPLDAGDPSQYGNGLIVLGKWTACGCGAGIPKTFIRLTTSPLAGGNTLHLESPAEGWNIGDEVALPDTHQLDYWEKPPTFDRYIPQNEVVKIAAISTDKKTLTLDRPLAFNHYGHVEKNGTTSIYPHVGLLSRNLILRSQNPNGVRGHVLATMAAQIHICHVQEIGMGRTTNAPLDSTTFNADGSVLHYGTNQIGRYALHIHHVHGHVHDTHVVGHSDDARRFTIDGVSVVNSSKWAITVHGSHYGLIKNNVIYDATGSGMAFEDGSESFNIVENNFVCKVLGTGSPSNDGTDGIGFWFHGPNNIVRNNVAANCYPGHYCYGFSITAKFLGNIDVPVSIETMDTISVNSHAITLPEFSGNEVYASCNGVTVWWLGTREMELVPGAVAGTIKNMKIWNCNTWGFYGYATQGLTLDGWWMRSDTRLAPDNAASSALFFSDYYTHDLVIKNCDITGYYEGIGMPSWSGGLLTVENCRLRNTVNIGIDLPWSVNGGANARPRQHVIRHCLLELGDATRFGPAVLIDRRYQIKDAFNGLIPGPVDVFDFQQMPGDNFKLFALEQDADFIVPAMGANGNGGYAFIGAPEPGLTNTQCLAKHGVCVLGEIAPVGHTTRPNIRGIIAG